MIYAVVDKVFGGDYYRITIDNPNLVIQAILGVFYMRVI